MSSISAVLATLYMPIDVPEGFIYRSDFLSEGEEEQLLERIKDIEFSEFRMRDKIARRRVAHFGWLYGYDSAQIEPGPPIPEFLRSLQKRAAALLEIEPNELVEALLTKYPPGAGIGWHRDAWVFGTVVAVSLLSPCRLRLREGASAKTRVSIDIEPRSAYVLRGAVRSRWQHTISPTKALRYSITFRTLRTSQKKKARNV
jgi:alkylated DNA repair protein (DNA oxidative demethylase)